MEEVAGSIPTRSTKATSKIQSFSDDLGSSHFAKNSGALLPEGHDATRASLSLYPLRKKVQQKRRPRKAASAKPIEASRRRSCPVVESFGRQANRGRTIRKEW